MISHGYCDLPEEEALLNKCVWWDLYQPNDL